MSCGRKKIDINIAPQCNEWSFSYTFHFVRVFCTWTCTSRDLKRARFNMLWTKAFKEVEVIYLPPVLSLSFMGGPAFIRRFVIPDFFIARVDVYSMSVDKIRNVFGLTKLWYLPLCMSRNIIIYIFIQEFGIQISIDKRLKLYHNCMRNLYFYTLPWQWNVHNCLSDKCLECVDLSNAQND